MPGAKGVQGIAVAATLAGGVLVWSGIRGWSVTGTLRDLITGVDPTGQGQADPISGTAAGGDGGGGGVTSGSAIATQALTYVGHPYLYGGAPGADGKHPWDCSSFINWVIGHDIGLAIPGYKPGKYDGTAHGPPTGSWLIWSGCRTVKRADIQAGDLIVWPTHIGIATSPTEMVSALSHAAGTVTSTFHGGSPGGETYIPRRLNAVTGKGPGGTGPAPKGSYTHAGLMKLWRAAGGSAATASNAACHAIQESSGNPKATSSNPDGGTNVGLWQLDTKGKGAGYSIAMLQNPLLNARVAVKGSSGGKDWSAWATPGC